MIDAETGVTTEGIPEILPESVDPFTWMQSPQRIRPALRDKAAIGVAHLWPKQCVIDPPFRRINIEIGRSLFQPREEIDQSPVDAVDIVSSDPHPTFIASPPVLSPSTNPRRGSIRRHWLRSPWPLPHR